MDSRQQRALAQRLNVFGRNMLKTKIVGPDASQELFITQLNDLTKASWAMGNGSGKGDLSF
jgi:hypothetical protein